MMLCMAAGLRTPWVKVNGPPGTECIMAKMAIVARSRVKSSDSEPLGEIGDQLRCSLRVRVRTADLGRWRLGPDSPQRRRWRPGAGL